VECNLQTENFNLEILGKQDGRGRVVAAAGKGGGKQCFYPATYIEIKMDEKTEI
jgi:hypothetical protein